ncbi:MAG: hypothetical protein GXO88_11705 [Chlorobi bacterium]|nr:hypothetical protein [Chlorobiota bacterium]
MKNLRKVAVVTALIMLPMFVATSFAQKKVMLSYKLTQGKSYKTLINIDQDIDFEANGQSMSLSQLMSIKTTVTIDKASATGNTTKTTITAIRMEQSIFGMDIVYDSEEETSKSDPMSKQIAQTFKKLIGNSYSVVFDNKGNVKEYDLGDFGKNNDMANNLSSGSSYVVYPDYKVMVNDSWEADIKPMETSDMNYHTKYTVIKITRKVVTLGVSTTISANNLNGETAKVKGEISGKLLVNTKTGWTISSEMDMDMSMELEQNGTKFPATISGTISTKPQEK